MSNQGVPPAGSGLRSFGPEPTALSQPEALVPNALIARLLHPTLGVTRGLLSTDSRDKLIKIRVGELRDIAAGLAHLNAECKRAWRAYFVAHEQAMANGSALAELRAAIATEAGTAETVKQGSVHEGAGLEEASPKPFNHKGTTDKAGERG